MASKKSVPLGASVRAVIHTNPNGNEFSKADKNYSKSCFMPLYVVTPNGKIRIYHDTRKGYKDEVVYKNVKFSSISNNLKKELKTRYKKQWKSYVLSDCGFGCRYRR